MLNAAGTRRRLERRLRLRKKIRRRWFQGLRSSRLREKSSQGLRPRMQWDAWDTSQIKIRAVGSEIDSAPNRPCDVIVPSERSSLRDSNAQIITLPSLLSRAETSGTRRRQRWRFGWFLLVLRPLLIHTHVVFSPIKLIALRRSKPFGHGFVNWNIPLWLCRGQNAPNTVVRTQRIPRHAIDIAWVTIYVRTPHPCRRVNSSPWYGHVTFASARRSRCQEQRSGAG